MDPSRPSISRVWAGGQIVCLQEMTEVPFRLLAARLAPLGLAAEYGWPAERSAATLEFGLMWRTAKLHREHSAVWQLGTLLDAPHSAPLRAQLEREAPSLAKFLRGQLHQLQAILFRTVASGRPLLCLNAHLIQNTLAANCRTFQAAVGLAHALAWAASLGVAAPSVVLCGDLNCISPQDGVLTYLAGREVPLDSYEWVYGRQLGCRQPRCSRACASVWRRDEQCPRPPLVDGPFCWDHTCTVCGGEKHNRYPTCEGCAPAGHLAAGSPAMRPPDGDYFAAALALPTGLRNAYEAVTGTSALTSLPFRPTTGLPVDPRRGGAWVECRDHIFCSRGLRVTAVLPPPADPETMRGMPSLTWPSDHLALVADLEWEEPVTEPVTEPPQADAPPHPPAPHPGHGPRDQPIAIPSPKRQKSDPGPATFAVRSAGDECAEEPRTDKQRSWGETTLCHALPEI